MTDGQPNPDTSRDVQAERVRHLMALLAPGTPIREGLDRIVNGRTGGLIVLGDGPEIDKVCSGGFPLDVRLTPQAMRELSKMDGGLVVSSDHERIKAAAVHFVPDGDLPTMETGTRHRTADRLSQQTGAPVVVVSASMSVMSLFLNGRRYLIEKPEQLLARANQALATLASYRRRLVEEAENLTALEIRDQVQVRDVAAVAQRFEMWRRIDAEVRGYVSALGLEGRLVQLQRNELSLGVEDLGRLLTEDYRPDSVSPGEFSLSGLQQLSWEDLLELGNVAEAINLGAAEHPLDSAIRARGHRQLTIMTDLSSRTIQRIIDHFNDLQSLVSASTSELGDIKGVGVRRAREIRQGLESIFEGDQRTHHRHSR
ncbi:DNA integrity scanning protein DisA [Cutibacterium sp. WCA-380-WT-3A]|uniref:DNA integrity scanning protein DisA n=1 Tax=Cutibacterium porci TaxID=2605781 RepID=A0A7K0J509_9ACTN|nr:DNA integrity scanning diadenylate cyclase DisA [Cutibacterium porci]MSS45002.1 DNA integrity scanning protein DisA [Cutibacterium porci]